MVTDQGLMLLADVFLTVTVPWYPEPQSWVIFQSTLTSEVAACAGVAKAISDAAAVAKVAIAAVVARVVFT